MSSTLMRSGLCLSVMLLALSAPAEAQISGLKKRVQRAVDKATGTQAATQQSARGASPAPYGDQVLEMTADVVDRLHKALAAEEAERAEIATLAASVKTPEAYQACSMEAVTSPEAGALMEDMNAKASALSDRPGDAAAAAAYRKAGQAVMDFMRERCGPDPEQFRSSELPQLQARPAQAGMKAGGFTATQYSILKERIPPLCGIAKAAGDGGVQIPGEGNNVFWVYSADEVANLVPRCDALTALLEATL